VTTNFTAFTVQRVHRRRNQVYEDKDFQIKSLNSLVKAAKQKHHDNFERIDTDASDVHCGPLPFHHFTEHLTENLHEMHHHLQSLLMQTLGPDARNVIAAERARLNHEERHKLERTESRREENQKASDYIAVHLSEVGQTNKDELELLNEYRERYAALLAELLIARDRLIEFGETMQRTAGAQLGRRLSGGLSEIGSDEAAERKRRREDKMGRRTSALNENVSEESADDVDKMRQWLQRRRKSSIGQGSSDKSPMTLDLSDWWKWN